MGRYSGATSLFMTVLLNKKYSLPYVVIDALVAHFLSFENDDRELPVLWHQVVVVVETDQQTLLTFAQRYKTELTADQKESLKPLLKKHYHHQITPEIRRELYTTVNRGEKESGMEMESFWTVCFVEVLFLKLVRSTRSVDVTPVKQTRERMSFSLLSRSLGRSVSSAVSRAVATRSFASIQDEYLKRQVEEAGMILRFSITNRSSVNDDL